MTTGYRYTSTDQPTNKARGPKHPQWKGGRRVHTNGYVLVLVDGKYVYEHRQVMSQHLRRPLASHEQVHHINGDKTDNRLENLLLANQRQHSEHHRIRTDLQRFDEPNPIIACACGCGGTFPKYDYQRRPRQYLPYHFTRGARR